MATLESRVWKKVRKAWMGHGVRIEASMGDADSGTPDCMLSWRGRGGWVELKVWHEPLRVSQRVWHAEALRDGATCVVLCEVGSGRYWIGYWYEYEALSRRPIGLPLNGVLSWYAERLGIIDETV